MAKKLRSQQRKKGKSMGADDAGEGRDADPNMEFLSEEHTIADSVTTFDSNFEEDLTGKFMSVWMNYVF